MGISNPRPKLSAPAPARQQNTIPSQSSPSWKQHHQLPRPQTSSSVPVFFPCNISAIGKSCWLYLQSISRMRNFSPFFPLLPYSKPPASLAWNSALVSLLPSLMPPPICPPYGTQGDLLNWWLRSCHSFAYSHHPTSLLVPSILRIKSKLFSWLQGPVECAPILFFSPYFIPCSSSSI